MTGKTLTDKALKIYGAINQSGEIDANKNTDYYTIAPSFIESIQEQLAIYEGISLIDNTISSLDDELEITDKTCNLCAIYLLAFMFAQLDADDKRATNFYELYNNNLKYIDTMPSEINMIYF